MAQSSRTHSDSYHTAGQRSQANLLGLKLTFQCSEESAGERRLPAMYHDRQLVDAGGLAKPCSRASNSVPTAAVIRTEKHCCCGSIMTSDDLSTHRFRKRKHGHLGDPSLLMRARAQATVRGVEEATGAPSSVAV
jgi:hypothetical protein